MLVGMQFGITKLLTTTGPQGPPQVLFPTLGSISSMLPMLVMAMEFEFGSNRWPVLGFQAMAPTPAGEIAPAQVGPGAV